MSILPQLTEGPRIFFSSWKNRVSRKKYEGDAKKICEQILDDCWNGRYLQTSTGHFNQFWTRDFGWCVHSLIKLKRNSEVQQTLRYALNRFKQAKKVTTAITPSGSPYNFPVAAVDSLPWFIHSIKVAKFPYYEHKRFLNIEIKKFFRKFIDPQTGLVKPELHVSSIKDHAVRKSSCYDNSMVALLAQDLKSLKLDNPFEKYNYPELLKRHFWNGEFFHDDLRKRDYVAGDANLFPFLLGVVNDNKMLYSSLVAVQQAGLDKPFPLQYTNSRVGVDFIWQESLARNYESTALWMHMGLLFAKLMQQVDPERAEEYKVKYTELIEKHKNFLEVYTKGGKPFKSPFYHADSGMLWAANYLVL